MTALKPRFCFWKALTIWLRWIGWLALLAILLGLAGCANLRIAGKILTPYGTIGSDGKTVTIEADVRGYAK